MEEKIKTGTTILAIKCKDGIVVASDTQATLGFLATPTSQKIFKLNDNIVAAIAGGVADAQTIIRYIRSQLKLKEIREGEVTVRAASYLISNILFSGSKSFIPYFSVFIVAGKDKNGFKIFHIGDMAGAIEEREYYAADGSGSYYTLATLDAEYKKGMSIKEGIKLALKCLKVSRKRDIGTGYRLDIWIIDKKGVRRLERKEIEEIEKGINIVESEQ